MITSVSHIALYVPDLQAAENFYKNLFDMELIGREVEKEGGLWYTLPFDKDWDSVKAAGIELGMSALGKGGGACVGAVQGRKSHWSGICNWAGCD